MFDQKKPLIFLYWIICGIFVFIFIYFLIKLFPVYGAVFSFLWKVLSPFILSCLIAYLLYPIVNKLHSYNIPRGIAILLIYLLFFGAIVYLIYRVYPMVVNQLRDLSEQLPQLIEMYRGLILQLYEYTSFLPETVHDKMDELIGSIEENIENLLASLVTGYTKVFDFIIFITVIPVLVFYFLKDYSKIKAYMANFVPANYQIQVKKLYHALEESLGGYLRGLLIVSLFVSLTTFIVFHFLGIKYALLLAIIMGLTNMIPYFGPIIGAVPVIAITLTISGQLVLIVIIAIFVIQLIESNLLSPYIVGKSVHIHPIAIIFALLLGGQVSGVIGMILAVPTLTILKVIASHIMAIRRYN